MRGKSCRSRTFRFETLERRALLAGDVTVTVTNHNVLIQSDNQDDTVVIQGTNNGGIEITSYDGTTINGQNVPFDIPSVNNLTIKMGDGNDHVALASPIVPTFIIGGGIPSQPLQQPIDIQGNLSISMGKGTDSVDVDYADISWGMTVGLGSGNSSVNVYNTTVNKNVDIRGGNGNDSINLSGTPVIYYTRVSPMPLATPASIIGLGPFQPTPPSNIVTHVQMVSLGTIIHGSVSIALGNGGDSIGLSQLRVDGSLMMTTGQGRDVISLGVAPTVFTPGSVNLIGTPATTTTPSTNVTIGGVLSLYTGNGGDDISMDSVQAKGIVLVTGQGADTVSVANATADVFFASLGGGDDSLDVGGGGDNIGSFLAFGGAGNDTFLNATSNSFKHKSLFLFEELG
ncbi:MAG TPA: hypothetical protein VGN12_17030 [Pirellulales bacterium]|jgi:hypothetical protein